MLDIQPAAPGRCCRRASGAAPVQHGHQAGHAGVCSPLNHHPLVAPRSAMTLTSEWCTCADQAANAEPSSAEPARTTCWSVPSRFSAWESVFRLRSITSATLVHRGAARAAIRRCSGCWRGARGPGQGVPGWRGTPLGLVDRPWAGGRAATGLQAYKDSLRAKVNVSTPARRRPSRQRSTNNDTIHYYLLVLR